MGADKYQQAVLDWVSNKLARPRTKQSALVVKALAGAGKTWTIEQCCRLLPEQTRGRPTAAAVVAYNKEIVEAVKPRLAGTVARATTVHQMGFGALIYSMQREYGTKPELDERKYYKATELWPKQVRSGFLRFPTGRERSLTTEESDALQEGARGWVGDVLRIFGLGRDGLIDFSRRGAVESIARSHSIELDDALVGLTCDALYDLAAWGRANTKTIDFGDMVWLPIQLKWKPRPYEWLFVDEAQDLSAARLELILMARAPTGCAVFVGDPHQAIYAFSGADSRAFNRIIHRTQADVLPLSICYRCPTSVLDLARTLCPEIEPRPDAPEGEVVELEQADIAFEVTEGDMVLCRRSAPLISLAFDLIANGIPVVVRGRDIGEGLVALATRVATAMDELGTTFDNALDQWVVSHCQWVLDRYAGDEESAKEEQAHARDQAECVRILWRRVQRSGGIEALRSEVARIFAAKPGVSVTLSTIHRAKGLENPTVFVLDADRLPQERTAAAGSRYEQEENLAYVAYTRASAKLVLVEKGAA